MKWLINYFQTQFKLKKLISYQAILKRGLTWKTLNPKSLDAVKLEN
jgi:hypothetical protein